MWAPMQHCNPPSQIPHAHAALPITWSFEARMRPLSVCCSSPNRACSHPLRPCMEVAWASLWALRIFCSHSSTVRSIHRQRERVARDDGKNRCCHSDRPVMASHAAPFSVWRNSGRLGAESRVGEGRSGRETFIFPQFEAYALHVDGMIDGTMVLTMTMSTHAPELNQSTTKGNSDGNQRQSQWNHSHSI